MSQQWTETARLILRDSPAAIAHMAQTARESRDTGVLSDYAAALLVRSDEADDGDLAAEALDASDRAINLDRQFAPALFNRALALERLGLLRAAQRAWREFLLVDSKSRWTDDALRHLRTLRLPDRRGEWERVFHGLQSAPQASIESAVRRFPEQARTWCEGVVMGQWADAVLKGDRAAAASHLRLAHEVASALRAQSGESLLYNSVVAAEAVRDTLRAVDLARAYAVYRDGRMAHAANRAAEAEVKLRLAEEAFARCASPMQYVAAYYVGSALHAQLRLDDAKVRLDALADEHPEKRGYLALMAMIGWERGACRAERGAISEAIDIFTRSRDVFRQLGEIDFAATMDAYLAACYDYIGDRHSGWKSRRRAFEALSRSGNEPRLLVVLDSAAATASIARRWAEADTLLGLSVNGAERERNPLMAAHSHAARARIAFERRNVATARFEVQNGYRWAALVKDPSGRRRAEADLALVDGTVRRGSDARAALARFDQGIGFYEAASRRIELAQAYLERARTYLLLNDPKNARRDVDAGIATVALERRQLWNLEQRASLLATSDSLFELAIWLAARDNKMADAFSLADQWKGRALVEMFDLGTDVSRGEVAPLPLGQIRTALSPGSAIVSYVALPDRLLILTVTRTRLVGRTIAIPRDRVAAILDAFKRAIENGSTNALQEASAAHAVLIGPIRDLLSGVQRVGFVMPASFSGLPLTALFDSQTGRFLIADVAIATAPSASLLITASQRQNAIRGHSVVSIGADQFDSGAHPDLPSLPRVRREAQTIAACYPRADVIVGPLATRATVSDALRTHAVVHFAGHAVSNASPARAALLVTPTDGDTGELTVADIARLRCGSARVVVLAACASAAPVRQGDGAENLARAFIAAGVPTVVATLRALDDDVSPRFMLPLHRRLAAGDDPVDAVRQVVLRQLHDRISGRPYSWAIFVVVGGSGNFVARS
jgi:CHAT domain-containing protein